eukprot:TRINITY_DN4328_c0_g1_i5.p1 TRINITY_DN4328_c0_g1~~TRINITY_DN4328_c0_g1_i5.p1  ORF type:complete len:317 (-),score=32.90 TRINITY_DN4328_c0_g1_i5:187-1137(-)
MEEDAFGWEQNQHSLPYLNHLIAGSCAGAVEHCSMLPMDTIKTHLQASSKSSGVLNVATTIFKTNGIRGFWHGAGIMFVGCIPAHSAYFTVYEVFRDYMAMNDGKVHALLSSLNGAMATVFHDIIYTPFDVLKQRKQILLDETISARHLLRNIIHKEGISSLFRSVPVTIFHNIPNAGVLVGVNDTLKVVLKPKDGHNFFSYFACALIAGASAACATIPLDVVKTKLQTQNTHKERHSYTSSASRFYSVNAPERELSIKYHNVTSTIKTILREEGPRGFIRGAVPRMMMQAPSSAISWATYESIKGLLSRVREAKH